MNAQTIVTPSGERLVLLPEADFQMLMEAAEDGADRAAVDAFRRRLAAGEEELIPSTVADRVLDGENRIRVWREHRGLTSTALAERVGIAQGHLSQIEAGRREGTLDTMRKIAQALGMSLDDLAG